MITGWMQKGKNCCASCMPFFLLLTSNRPYCKALNKHQGKPNKKDPICQKGNKANGPWGFDVADYAYHYNGKVYQKAGKNK